METNLIAGFAAQLRAGQRLDLHASTLDALLAHLSTTGQALEFAAERTGSRYLV